MFDKFQKGCQILEDFAAKYPIPYEINKSSTLKIDSDEKKITLRGTKKINPPNEKLDDFYKRYSKRDIDYIYQPVYKNYYKRVLPDDYGDSIDTDIKIKQNMTQTAASFFANDFQMELELLEKQDSKELVEMCKHMFKKIDIDNKKSNFTKRYYTSLKTLLGFDAIKKNAEFLNKKITKIITSSSKSKDALDVKRDSKVSDINNFKSGDENNLRISGANEREIKDKNDGNDNERNDDALKSKPKISSEFNVTSDKNYGSGSDVNKSNVNVVNNINNRRESRQNLEDDSGNNNNIKQSDINNSQYQYQTIIRKGGNAINQSELSKVHQPNDNLIKVVDVGNLENQIKTVMQGYSSMYDLKVNNNLEPNVTQNKLYGNTTEIGYTSNANYGNSNDLNLQEMSYTVNAQGTQLQQNKDSAYNYNATSNINNTVNNVNFKNPLNADTDYNFSAQNQGINNDSIYNYQAQNESKSNIIQNSSINNAPLNNNNIDNPTNSNSKININTETQNKIPSALEKFTKGLAATTKKSLVKD